MGALFVLYRIVPRSVTLATIQEKKEGRYFYAKFQKNYFTYART
jgi:hypothetical protein